MNKWELLKNIQDGLKAKKVSKTEALNMLNEAIKLHVEDNLDVEYEVLIIELKKLRLLAEKINTILEENTLLERHNEKLLKLARMPEDDFKKNMKNSDML